MAVDETPEQRKSREKLCRTIHDNQKQAYSAILDFVEVSLGDPDKFKPLRSKILRASNDVIRRLERELERNYVVNYSSTSEDVIVVNQPK